MPTSLDVELIIKSCIQGANAGERLSFGLDGKVVGEMPLLPTGLGSLFKANAANPTVRDRRGAYGLRLVGLTARRETWVMAEL